jgi:Protein of unknown function (DUF1573)
MKKYKYSIIVSVLLLLYLIQFGCYTETKKPDYQFMKSVKQQSQLDSSKKTTIEITPKKYFFGKKKHDEDFTGFFWIKNKGSINFNIVSIESNCDCIKTEYTQTDFIPPGDSLKISYQLNIQNQRGLISNSIIAVGNCQYGNQTFYLEGSIF